MNVITHGFFGTPAAFFLAASTTTTGQAPQPRAIEDRFAEVNGIRLHYLAAGEGDPVILLHGYAQTSHMWRPLIVELAKTHAVIAPDLRGFGQTSMPDPGIQTTLLSGNPAGPGLYTLRLSVPPNTRIEAHANRDDRSVTVVSGTWYLGYGSSFDEKALKALPPGSFYSELAGQPHFAETRADPVIVYITGYGPTNTTYVDGAGDPRTREETASYGRTGPEVHRLPDA